MDEVPTTSRNLAKQTYLKHIREQEFRIRDLKESEKKLQWELTHDTHILELLNFKGFEERVIPQVSLALRENSTLAFGFVDMDRMKAVNDEHGHDKGDEVIGLLGKILDKYFKRESDIIALDHDSVEVVVEEKAGGLARRGGDEFLIATPATEIGDLSVLLEKAREEFERESKELTPGIEPSFSFGISILGEELAGGYNRDKIVEGNLPTSRISEQKPDPKKSMLSGLQVAEMRMYNDKTQRKQGRK